MTFASADAMQLLAQLPAVFFDAIDQRRYEAAAALMAEKGVWRRQGKALQGGGGVLAALQERAANRHTSHIVTNVIVEPQPSGGRVTFHLTAYEYVGDLPPPYPLVSPGGIGRYIADCTREGDEWRIADLKSEVLFKAEKL